MQRGDEEIGNNYKTSDAKAMWPALSEQHRAKDRCPDAMTEGRQQAANHRFYDRGSHVTVAEQENREGIAGTFQGRESHTDCSSQQQSIHFRIMAHMSGQKHNCQDFTPLLYESNEQAGAQG